MRDFLLYPRNTWSHIQYMVTIWFVVFSLLIKGSIFASYESPAQLVLRREATEDASESLAFYGSMEL